MNLKKKRPQQTTVIVNEDGTPIEKFDNSIPIQQTGVNLDVELQDLKIDKKIQQEENKLILENSQENKLGFDSSSTSPPPLLNLESPEVKSPTGFTPLIPKENTVENSPVNLNTIDNSSVTLLEIPPQENTPPVIISPVDNQNLTGIAEIRTRNKFLRRKFKKRT